MVCEFSLLDAHHAHGNLTSRIVQSIPYAFMRNEIVKFLHKVEMYPNSAMVDGRQWKSRHDPNVHFLLG